MQEELSLASPGDLGQDQSLSLYVKGFTFCQRCLYVDLHVMQNASTPNLQRGNHTSEWYSWKSSPFSLKVN